MTPLIFLFHHHCAITLLLYTFLYYMGSGSWVCGCCHMSIFIWATAALCRAPNWRDNWWQQLENHLANNLCHVPETDWVIQERSQHWQLVDVSALGRFLQEAAVWKRIKPPQLPIVWVALNHMTTAPSISHSFVRSYSSNLEAPVSSNLRVSEV